MTYFQMRPKGPFLRPWRCEWVSHLLTSGFWPYLWAAAEFGGNGRTWGCESGSPGPPPAPHGPIPVPPTLTFFLLYASVAGGQWAVEEGPAGGGAFWRERSGGRTRRGRAKPQQAAPRELGRFHSDTNLGCYQTRSLHSKSWKNPYIV